MSHRSAVTLLVGVLPLMVSTAAAQAGRVGAHYGVNLSNGHWEDERLGLQASVHIAGPLETAGAFSLFTDWPGASGFTGSALPALLSRPAPPPGPRALPRAGSW